MSTLPGCLPWMQNQNDQNPCTTAQQAGRLCDAGYSVSSTDFRESDHVPNATTTNDCTCSWSIYNLISACSYCVGQLQYTSWGTWISSCGSHASNTSYFPTGLTISEGIPYWAATNPSTWENSVFNITQAANIAAADHKDVTGGPLPTSISAVTASSAVESTPRVLTGPIVASVFGALAIIIIGGLIVFCAARRHQRQATLGTPFAFASFDASNSQPAMMPSAAVRSGGSAQPPPLGHPYVSLGQISTSPVLSTTSLPLTSPVASPVSSGFSHGFSAVRPHSNAADMITPFLAQPSASQINQSKVTAKAAEALSGRSRAPEGQRTRLNPPPYSASVGSVSGESARAAVSMVEVPARKQKRRNGSVTSGATMISGHSRTSTKESMATVYASPLAEKSTSRAAALSKEKPERMERAAGVGDIKSGGSGIAETVRGENAGTLGQRRLPTI